jgi:ABC-2 type transport system permease protein
MIASFGFGLCFMMVVMLFGQTTAQNTVVEKQTRVVEILLAAVPAKVLMAGKVLGNAALALGQVALLVVAALAGLALGGNASVLSMVGPALIWYLVFFIFGFVLFASLMAGSAALVSRMEDVGAVLQPTVWLVMIPYIVSVGFSDNRLVMAVASYVPISSPVAMPLRVLMGEASAWEPWLALALMLVTVWGAIALGGRIYAYSLLRTGSRVKFREALAKRDAPSTSTRRGKRR